MIAYDFDGVIVPDYVWVTGCSDSDFQSIASAACPIFTPPNDYLVITARTPDLQPETQKILDRSKRVPLSVHYRTDTTLSPAQHKARVLKTLPQVTVFVESDYQQVQEIAKDWQGTVIHWPEFLSDVLSTLHNDK